MGLTRSPGRWIRAAVCSLSIALLAGACASSESSDSNKALPRKSREESLAWAKSYTATMARHADVTIGGKYGPHTRFENCIGRNGEVADDGRYTLAYTVYAQLPGKEHAAALRRLRTALEKDDGAKVTSYQEQPQSLLFGRSEERDGKAMDLVVGSAGPSDTLRLSVRTPCFLPPGARQQRF
ncbi:hypothetical protein [Streptomyces sp. NPDC003077]|uniref:hypothetical protein n=1 Tax=Streptomyces sp. NPDC003077 TaxID=3154443 RepID=UPI0033B2D610